MNNSNINNTYNESAKENFVVMYNNINLSDNKKVRNYTDSKKSREIIEYTDDVADQVRRLYKKITISLEDYFQGKNNITDINNKIKQFYKNIKNYCITTGLMNEDNEAYKSKIIKDIYRSYRYNAVIAAVNINDIEGKKFELKLLGEDKSGDEYFIYYNSDYFFACELLRNTLTDMVNRLAIEEKINNFDTQSIDKRKRYVYDYGFNDTWSWSNKINIGNGININKNIVPPEKIKVFYMKYLDSQKNGKLLIQYEDNNIEIDLQTKDRLINENCNLHDILKRKNIQMDEDDNINDFLNAFCISTQDSN